MIYFISDVHLAHEAPEENRIIEDRLIELLRKLKEDCDTLFIVGDLFDYWFEYKTVIPRAYIRTLSEIYNLRQAGIKIEYIMGNHDFGHNDFFEKELGIPIHKDDIERTLHGKKFYISHGDGKVDNDTGYLILKRILRNKVAQKLFSYIHPDFGIWLASRSSNRSRGYTSKKNFGRRNGMKEFSKKKLEEGFDYVIMGHSHKAEEYEFGSGRYINLGEGFGKATFATFDGEELKLLSVDEFLKSKLD